MAKHQPLPVDAVLPDVLASLAHTPNLVLEAPPGAGKTTRVPPALLSLVKGDILVLEPRRLAARMAARRVADELNERVGETVGYQVRFEESIGPRTRLRFLTEGILTRRMVSDPVLAGVDAVILDEFHERHLEGDLALALLKRLQRSTRPDLRLIVMSATLAAAPIARYLSDCPILRSEGRLYPLSIEHLPYSPDALAIQVRRAAEQLHREGHTGNILTFLPGLAEIRRAERELAPLSRTSGLTVLPLHGDLTPAEQDRAVLPSAERKLILATNVAESSVTVEGVSAVIDSGLARMAAHSPWTGLPTLKVARVSKASATQRAGRAGRTGPGRVLRLYPEADFLLRPDHDLPEIARDDLSQLLLTLRAMNIEDPGALDWLDPPPPDAQRTAAALLERLGAHGDTARRLARLPLPPRLARLVVEALDRNIGEDGCRVAALLAAGIRSQSNDLLTALDAQRAHPDPHWRRQFDQLLRVTRAPRQTSHDEQALLLSVLAGFPDRVARVRSGTALQLSTGLAAEVAGEPPRTPFVVALEAEDREDQAAPLVRMTAPAEPEWLLELFPNRLAETDSLAWNRTAERVEAVRTLRYDELVLEETRAPAPPEAAADLLAQKAEEAGLARFLDEDQLNAWLARVRFAGLETPPLHEALRELSLGLTSFNELRQSAPGLLPLLESKLDRRRLEQLAPATLRLGSGRQTRVHYEADRAPWIASRLQDFFGMTDTPRLGPDRTPVVVHLLAPNQRAVQTTTDLAGFWQRLYPQVRRELMRRYPRHAWPENPHTPTPARANSG